LPMIFSYVQNFNGYQMMVLQYVFIQLIKYVRYQPKHQ